MEINGGIIDAVLLGSLAFTAAYVLGPYVNAREAVAKSSRASFDATEHELKVQGVPFKTRRADAKTVVRNKLNLKGVLK